MFIQVQDPTLNRNLGKYQLPHIWDHLLMASPTLQCKPSSIPTTSPTPNLPLLVPSPPTAHTGGGTYSFMVSTHIWPKYNDDRTAILLSRSHLSKDFTVMPIMNFKQQLELENNLYGMCILKIWSCNTQLHWIHIQYMIHRMYLYETPHCHSHHSSYNLTCNITIYTCHFHVM